MEPGGRADSVSDNIVSDILLWWICSFDVCFQYKSLFKQQKHLIWPWL